MRAAIYVDGFNLYHSINDLRLPYLKWTNLWKLGEGLIRGHAASVERVVFCSAFFPGDHGKKARHQAYIDAMKIVGVTVKLGHTVNEPNECKDKNCRHKWVTPREKETDINLALSMYHDATVNVYDVAFLISADTDQAATLRTIKENFPNKSLVTVFPPKRPPSQHLRDLSNGTVSLTVDDLDRAALPAVLTKQGFRTVVRPAEYAPPAGWIHPDSRPTRVAKPQPASHSP